MMALDKEQQTFFFKVSASFLVTAPNKEPKTYWLTVGGKRTPYTINQGVLLRLRTLVRDTAGIPEERALIETARMVCFLAGHLSRDLETAQSARDLKTALEAAFPAMV